MIANWVCTLAALFLIMVCSGCVSISPGRSEMNRNFPWVGREYPSGRFGLAETELQRIGEALAKDRQNLLKAIDQLQSKEGNLRKCIVLEGIIVGGPGAEARYEWGILAAESASVGTKKSGEGTLVVPDALIDLIQEQMGGHERWDTMPVPSVSELDYYVLVSLFDGSSWSHKVALNPWGVLQRETLLSTVREEVAALRCTSALLSMFRVPGLTMRCKELWKEFNKTLQVASPPPFPSQ